MNALLTAVPGAGAFWLLVLPAAAAGLLALVPAWRAACALNVLASFLTFLAALSLLAVRPGTGAYILADDLNIIFIVVNGFVAFTTALYSATYVRHEVESGRFTPYRLRIYHAMFQTLVFSMNLGLISNNLGVMWVAIELATLATVLMVGLYRTPEAIEAAWKYFMLGSVGIALALFGTILVYMAAQPVVGEGQDGMVWSVLIRHVADFDPALLNLAFVFLLLGYGTKAGLSPLNAWLPDAHAEGPTPIAAVLSGLLLNVALYALLRFKMLMDANAGAMSPGPLFMAMGLLSLLLTGVMLYRRHDIKRLFGYSSIEHMGIMMFAFGIGGPLANFAGLLHMVMHSLTKSAIFFSVGQITQIYGTQKISQIRGLTTSHPVLGWGLVAGVLAIAGMPPAGVFMSEFLLVTSTAARPGWMALLALPLVAGILLAFGALVMKLSGMAFGAPNAPAGPFRASWLPMVVHLVLVLLAGLYLPATLALWLQQVAGMLG
ncbi:hydrogenase 4 subunit F [Xanthobacter sp. TB0136]|uniref:hydrogenase 4 subunit F n=1 Tax=Xanthobacter sp. TB0136 TaxID=3459177 RepID=UPI00403A3BC4